MILALRASLSMGELLDDLEVHPEVFLYTGAIPFLTCFSYLTAPSYRALGSLCVVDR